MLQPPGRLRPIFRLLGTCIILLLVVLTSAQDSQNGSSGLQVDVTHGVGCGRKSSVGDTVSMHYKGTLRDGSTFDSSYSRDEPFSFTLGSGEVIRGWDEGLLDMCIGEERKLTLPPNASHMAYGHSALPGIPADSTLIFETKLISVNGIDQNTSNSTSPDTTTPVPEPSSTPSNSSTVSTSDASNGKCQLLGPFAIYVQAFLGLLALLSLVWKRYRERPRRPVKVWFFDVSKQVFGSVLLHVANLAMSELSAGDYELSSSTKQVEHGTGRQLNPCSFYFINIAVDTTLGIPILIVLLKVLHRVAAYTPLAKPPESMQTGNYGQPPHVSWWLKQSIVYFIGLLLMKTCVLFIFILLPWIALVGDWALRWTEGREALQIAFVMFIFPLIMNAVQYYIIDSFIKDSKGGEDEREAEEEDGDGESREPLRGAGSYEYEGNGRESGESEEDKVVGGGVGRGRGDR